MGEKEIKGLDIWLPEKEGEELEGTIVKVDSEGQFGLQATIKNKNGEEIMTPSHKWLQNQLRRLEAGDKVRIVFKGEEPPKVKGQSPTKVYQSFKVD